METPNRNFMIGLTFTFPDQREGYVIWDLELYVITKRNTDLPSVFFDPEKNGFGVEPVSVKASIYLNPKIMEAKTPFGVENVLVGKWIMDLDLY